MADDRLDRLAEGPEALRQANDDVLDDIERSLANFRKTTSFARSNLTAAREALQAATDACQAIKDVAGESARQKARGG